MLALSQDTPRWFALTARHQHEKSAAAFLGAQSLQTALPLYRARRRWSDRIQTVELPVFTGYVFCRLRPAERARALAAPGITGMVSFGGRPEPIEEGEIDAIRTAIGSGATLEPWPYLKVGDPVRIDRGPLRGLSGRLVEQKDNYRLVVNVEMLQRSLAVELDRDAIWPLQTAVLAAR